MFIKKLTSFVLITLIMFSTTSQLSQTTLAAESKNLADFIKNNDKIEAKFSYPSMKLSSNHNGKAVLPAHTAIMIQCNDTISTKNIASGATVHFSVVNDIKNSDGLVLIKAGTPVSAQISFVEENGMIGKSGKLTISDFHTTAIDGTYIPLSGTVSSNPEDKMVLSIVLSILVCPLFLLLKGGEGSLPAGTIKTAYTITDISVNANRI